jgi:uncharacterized protein with HEPN domain
MPSREDLIRLRHMLDCAEEAMALARDQDRASLAADRVLSLAIVRLLEIIGEAAGRVSGEVRAAEAGIPWGQGVGLRNRLIHGYDSVDMEVLWRIVTADLPPLATRLRAIPGVAEIG